MMGTRSVFSLSLTRLVGLILVPLTIIGVMLWGLWDPASRMEAVTAAIVNNDEPVVIDGQITPLGRVIAAELIGTNDQNFTWVLTSEEEAEEGLLSAKYAAQVVIPENFSAAATSLSDGVETATQAVIEVRTNDRAKLLDAALTQAVTQAATRAVNDQLGTAFVGNIFVGMNDLKDGITQIESGAKELADGQHQLTQGLNQLATGTSELSSGASQLAAGTDQLASGANQAAAGAGQLAFGVGELADGAEDLAGGAKISAQGSQQVAEGIGMYVSEINGVLSGITAGLDGIDEGFLRLVESIMASTELSDDQKEMIVEMLTAIKDAIPEGISEQLQAAIDGGNDLAAGAQLSATGSKQIADGVDELAVGVRGLHGGALALTTGVSGLASGADQLAVGSGELAAGIPELSAGVDELAKGSGEVASGADKLVKGLGTVTEEMPEYSESERERMAELMLNPVALEGQGNSLFTGSGAPLFLAVALWAGGLAAFLLIPSLSPRTWEAAGSNFRIALRSTGFSFLGGALQGLIAGIFAGMLLGLKPGAILNLVILATLGGVVFALVNQGLVALFGGFGRFISFVILVTGFVAGIVSTTPAVLTTIANASPLGPLMKGAQNILEGASLGLGTGLQLLLWAALGIVLISLAARKLRSPKAL